MGSGSEARQTDARLGRATELAQKIATLVAPPPVVLISGYAQNQQQLDLPFLRKPFRPNELVTMLAQVLAG